MKNKKVLIIGGVIGIIFVIIAVLAILYFTTDLFKTNKQLFYETISETKLIDNDFLKQFQIANERVTKNSHSSTMDMYVSTAKSNEDTSIADVQKLFTIKSNGLKNTLTNQEYKDFIISLTENSEIILKLIRDDNTYGIGADNILAKYLAIENTNLKEFATKLGITDTNDIPDSIQTSNYEELFEINQQTLENMQTKYFNIIDNQIDKSHYYKITNNDKTITYGVSLTEQEVINILKLIMETAKNDSNLLNLIVDKAKLMQYNDITVESIQQKLQESIDTLSLKETENNKDFLKIDVTRREEKAIKLKIEINDNNKEEIVEETILETDKINKKYTLDVDFSEANKLMLSAKENDKEMMNIVISYEYNTNNINTNIEILLKENGEEDTLSTGFIKLQQQIKDYQTDNITQTMNLDVNMGTEVTYQFNYTNNIVLKQDIQISKLTTENSVKINDLTSEQLKELLQALIKRIMEVYGEDFNNILNITTENTNAMVLD